MFRLASKLEGLNLKRKFDESMVSEGGDYEGHWGEILKKGKRAFWDGENLVEKNIIRLEGRELQDNLVCDSSTELVCASEMEIGDGLCYSRRIRAQVRKRSVKSKSLNGVVMDIVSCKRVIDDAEGSSSWPLSATKGQ